MSSSTSSSPEKKNGTKKHARLDPSTPWLISDSLSEHHVSRNKRLKAMVKETPWADQWEFESVGRSLIHAARILPQRQRNDDNNLSSLQQALRRVSVWKLRGTNRLPHAVESSHQLAQCLWNDYYYCRKERRGAEELRLAYGCSILRSINGLADKMQQTRYHAGSVAMLCAELGVPSWLVDIRHDSTHNQIPTLSVLRLSAITLLEYYHQEFWVPRMSHDETAHLMELLQDYQQSQQQATLLIEESPSTTPTASSPPPNKNTAASPSKTSRKSPNDSSSTDSNDDDESEEEVYVDGLNPSSTSSFWRPPAAQLGTNVNRFAALVNKNDKASKKKQQTKPPKTIAAPPAKKIKTTGPSAHHMAMKFVKAARSHWELAQHTALLFLVWGDKGAAAALIPTDNNNVSSPQTEEGIQTMRKQYTPLLSVLGKQWPGFLPALMTHLVDHILLLNQESSSTNSTGGTDDSSAPAMMESPRQSTSTERKLFFLESWVRYLVSREFVSKVHAVPKSSRSTKAPWGVLQKMWCPLNSLCDRLVVASSSSEGSALPTIQRLAEYLELVLGSNRVANFGVVEYPQCKEPQKDCNVKMGGETSQTSVEASKDTVETQKESAFKPPVSKEAKTDANLSLDELEAMLFNADSNKGEEGSHPVSNAASGLPTESSKVDAESQKKVTLPQTKQRTAWVRCAVWEPCAIGTLPGHLN